MMGHSEKPNTKVSQTVIWGNLHHPKPNKIEQIPDEAIWGVLICGAQMTSKFYSGHISNNLWSKLLQASEE